MAEQTYTLKQIEDTIREQGFKYVCLKNQTGVTIVPFNRPVDKKVSALKKMEEIKKRFKALPDGIYFVIAKNSLHTSIEGDSFPVAKGNVSLSERPQMQQQPVYTGDPNKVVTYQEALAMAKEGQDWQRKYETQLALYNQLQGQYNELKEQLEESEDLEEENPVGSWAKDILPSLLPVLDRHMTMQERKLKMKEAATFADLAERGIIPGGKQARQNGNGRQIPKPGTPQFDQYLDQVSELADDKFEKEMLYLYNHHPEAYEIAYNELVEQEGEEEEEQEEEQQEEKE
jgi:hypothetical protein